MRILKVILITAAVLVAIVFIGGMFLPKTYSVSRSVKINAAGTVVYNNVANFNSFLKWNPWYKMDPKAKIDVSGTPLQVGHMYRWDGEESGQGQMEIRSLEPLKLIDIDLTFLKPFESTADTKFELQPEGDSTKVTWTMAGENKSALEKWMGLAMGGMIGDDFESGLQSLKELSEKAQ